LVGNGRRQKSYLKQYVKFHLLSYKPPAHWHRLANVSQHIDIPLIANGEMWSPSDVTSLRLDQRLS
jgi:tRNA-dihydrouridine synthase C